MKYVGKKLKNNHKERFVAHTCRKPIYRNSFNARSNKFCALGQQGLQNMQKAMGNQYPNNVNN